MLGFDVSEFKCGLICLVLVVLFGFLVCFDWLYLWFDWILYYFNFLWFVYDVLCFTLSFVFWAADFWVGLCFAFEFWVFVWCCCVLEMVIWLCTLIVVFEFDLFGVWLLYVACRVWINLGLLWTCNFRFEIALFWCFGCCLCCFTFWLLICVWDVLIWFLLVLFKCYMDLIWILWVCIVFVLLIFVCFACGVVNDGL